MGQTFGSPKPNTIGILMKFLHGVVLLKMIAVFFTFGCKFDEANLTNFNEKFLITLAGKLENENWGMGKCSEAPSAGSPNKALRA